MSKTMVKIENLRSGMRLVDLDAYVYGTPSNYLTTGQYVLWFQREAGLPLGNIVRPEGTEFEIDFDLLYDQVMGKPQTDR